MKFWIGVVGSKVSFSRLSEEPTWFCLPAAAGPNDRVLLYASKFARGTNSGIFAAYEVSKKSLEKNDVCRQYGNFHQTGQRLEYAELNLVSNFSKPISFQEMKNSGNLANTTFIRRNMQATYFEILEKDYGYILQLRKSI